jgi:glycosyltransferase 2 family protein
VLVARVGAGPFVDALRVTSVWALVAGTAVAALTTVCGAWRWCLVSRGLGVELTLRSAVAAYYRSQLLNATLPGGVVGDVHRGVRHGRQVGAVGRGVRSVAWERSLGQVVQIALTVVVLLVLPSPLHSTAVVVAVVAVALALVVVAGTRSRQMTADSEQGHEAGWPARLRRVMSGDLRGILRGRPASWGVALTSLVALLGHAVVFLLAVQATGASLPAEQLVPLTLIVLVASAVPTNVAGWGPREGVAAWAFAAYGLTAAQGVTTAAVFGVLVLAGTLPGVAVLLRDLVARHSAGAATDDGPQMAGALVTYRHQSGVGDGRGTEGDRRLAGIGRG